MILGPDSEFGAIPGVLRTRVGYCGGEKPDPTYHSLGDHTEAISVDYDPDVTSYEKLLAHFWAGHRCGSSNISRQYMNAVFYRDENQRQLAEASRLAEATRRNIAVSDIKTGILPINQFTYAEDYHQKYILTRYSELRSFLNTTYPDAKSLADSTVATRLNAYLGSRLRQHAPALLEQLPTYGLPADIESSLRKLAGGA